MEPEISAQNQKTDTLRVALDVRLSGYRAGGIARYARELQKALTADDGITVRAIHARNDKRAGDDDFRIWTPPHHKLERLALPVEIMLRRFKPDVYHATDFITPLAPGVPAVATVHDLAFVHWPDDLTPDALAFYRQLGESRRRTAAWITPSSWTADDLAGIYGIERDTIHVIPHGVSLDLLDNAPLPLAEREPYVLAVGTVEPRKRYDLLLDAWATRDDLPQLVVAGNPGWNSRFLEGRLRASDSATWHSNANDINLRELYRKALALVVPSRAEGFGLPALEAMAVGTPVISSGRGGLPEVTGDAALTVAEPDAEQWADAVDTLTRDADLWQRLSDAGRQRASQFSWEKAAAQTAAVYRALAN